MQAIRSTGPLTYPPNPSTTSGLKSARIFFACDEDLEDNLCELGERELFAVEIHSIEDVAAFSDIQYAIKNPLCIICDDAVLLEKALRSYQGRPLYEGTLSDAELLPLAEKYGLII